MGLLSNFQLTFLKDKTIRSGDKIFSSLHRPNRGLDFLSQTNEIINNWIAYNLFENYYNKNKLTTYFENWIKIVPIRNIFWLLASFLMQVGSVEFWLCTENIGYFLCLLPLTIGSIPFSCGSYYSVIKHHFGFGFGCKWNLRKLGWIFFGIKLHVEMKCTWISQIEVAKLDWLVWNWFWSNVWWNCTNWQSIKLFGKNRRTYSMIVILWL